MKRVEGAVELELEEKKEETGVTLPDVPHQLTHSLLDHSPCFCAWNICRSHQSNTRFREPDPLYSAIFNQHSYFLFPIRVTILKSTFPLQNMEKRRNATIVADEDKGTTEQ